MRERGTVKNFNPEKGWGFIRPEAGGDDVFVHHSEIRMPGFRTLSRGQQVEYTRVRGERGTLAQAVERIESEGGGKSGSRGERE
ncbi:MAG: cold-shock protein [Terriglobales bacterium]